MKKLFFIAFLFVQIAVYLQALLSDEMHERPSSMGIHPAFEAAVPKVGVKVAEELFENSMQKRKMRGLIKRKADSKKSG